MAVSRLTVIINVDIFNDIVHVCLNWYIGWYGSQLNER